MSALNQDADGQPEDWTAERAILLLERALEIVDRWGDRPAVGAKLQQVIDDIRDTATS
jgi:hypothetical protein